MADTLGRRFLRGIGWLFLSAGAVVLLYLVYSLLFTNLQTESAQSDLLEDWELEVGALREEAAAPVAAAPAPAPPAPVSPGDALAALQFIRPGSSEPIVSGEPMFVVSGVGVADLRDGPGHYPTTGLPGAAGNFAVAGHRTTYGAPFYHLDQLVPGDEVWVTDRSGARYTYRVVEQRIVSPDDGSVLAPDPRQTGRPTLTLTTCHPRFSNAQRLIVFAELV
jgi:sortase A